MDRVTELEERVKKVEMVLEQILETYDIYKDRETNKFFYYSACDSQLNPDCSKNNCWNYSDCYKKSSICSILNNEII